MSETTGMYRALHELNKQVKRKRTNDAPNKLAAAGLTFSDKNMGAHLIVSTGSGIVDFWPANEAWIPRGSGTRQYGIDELIAYAKEEYRECGE